MLIASHPKENGMDLDYTTEKYRIAVSCLCGFGDIRERIYNALVPGLMNLRHDDFPLELREKHQAIMLAVHANVMRTDEGWFRDSLATLDEMAIRSLVEKILSVHESLIRQCPE
jgi:hypothetical protein